MIDEKKDNYIEIPNTVAGVIIKDIDIKFFDLMLFFIKAVLALVPAMIIASIFIFAALRMFAGFFMSFVGELVK